MRANKGAAGIDGLQIDDFIEWSKIHWKQCRFELFNGSYQTVTGEISMRYQLFKLSQFLRGWINYYGIANVYQDCVELDHWIRRRVRMCYWRQWRKPRTKVANLLKRGVRI